MANWFQKLIYSVSNVVPILIIGAIVWCFKLKTFEIPLVLIGLAAIIAVTFGMCFANNRKHLSLKTINVTGIESQDGWLFTYVLVYLLPMASLVVSDYNIVVLMIVIIILLNVVFFSVVPLPNFLLFCAGYHFYKLETDSTGIKDYLMISKKKRLRNKDNVVSVIRMFEKLLVDTEGDK